MGGAEIGLHTRVLGDQSRAPTGRGNVVTDKGTIHANTW